MTHVIRHFLGLICHILEVVLMRACGGTHGWDLHWDQGVRDDFING